MSDETSLSEPFPDRRRLVLTAISGFIGSICAGLGLPSLAYLLSPPKAQPESQWAEVGDLADFESGTPRPVTFRRIRTDGWSLTSEKESAWVVREPGGKVTAFSPRCTHLGCAFGWDSARGQFVCPCHDSRFAVDGRRMAGPALRGLDQYEVRRAGSRLWLRTAAKKEAARS